MTFSGKLLRFMPYLSLREAAELLGELIDEDVTEDNILELHSLGHLPSSFVGCFVGLPIHPPKKPSEEFWPILYDELDQLPPIYTKELIYPLCHVNTNRGFAPIHKVDGTPYAWFSACDDEGTVCPLEEVVPPLREDAGEHALFRVNDVIFIAAAANAKHELAPSPRSKPEGEAWHLNANGGQISCRLHPPTWSGSMEAKPVVQPAPATASHLLTIAAMMELLGEPGRVGRNQSAIMAEIQERRPGKRGLSKRNLEDIFAAANKAKADVE